MKTILTLLLAMVAVGSAFAQERPAALEAHNNLVGGTWKGDGAWTDGTAYKPELQFSQGLSGNMIKTMTSDETGAGGERGLRGEGVRVWDAAASTLRFWEFDVFGGITEGTGEAMGKDIYLHYTYDAGQGPTLMTDAWLYRSDDLYELNVGVYENGVWQQKFLTIEMRREP